MKLPLYLSSCALSALIFIGCSGDSNKPSNSATNAPATNASSGSPLTAPVDYLAAAGKAQQTAVKTVDVTSINQAIQLFNVDQGRYPKDLNELVEKKFMPKIPAAPYGTKLAYDANTGKVSVVKE
jgi:hypothetical protein